MKYPAVILAILTAIVSMPSAYAAQPALIDRDLFFGEVAISAARISP
ncbi:MAG: hypothetical protein QOF42_3826, partial [Gammaproteobacteria bacterium]|nr:hypothetical protein [Gammaproteobacteria bacterium]